MTVTINQRYRSQIWVVAEAFTEAFVEVTIDITTEVLVEVATEIAAEVLTEAAGGLGYCLQIWLIVPVIQAR